MRDPNIGLELRPDPLKGRQRHAQRGAAQKGTLFVVMCVSLLCFGSAAVLATGGYITGDRQLTAISTGRPTDVIVEGVDPNDDALNVDVEDLDIAEPEAATFLVTGADSGDCENQNDPTVGNRSSERSDTIMLWRVNPENDQMAILSMPRDLWVERPGGFKSRINTAYDPADPQELIDTIYLNFDIEIDHYLQIDFCAFRTVVDAVGGVAIPFDYPARDPASLLDIRDTGCVVLNGDMSLSYVRSRHYEYEYPVGSGNWNIDPTSDFGRIARQQDFIRRVVSRVISTGLYSPAVLTGLIRTNSKYLVYDTRLTVGKMLEFGNSVRNLDPAKIATYRVASYPDTVRGATVERPRLNSGNMQAILSIFRGDVLLADAPQQNFTDTTIGSEPSEAAESTDGEDAPEPADLARPTDTRPVTSEKVGDQTFVDVASNNTGIIPDPNVSCE